MPVVGQRRDRDVGDVVGVDERLRGVTGRKGDLAAEHVLEHVVLAEVLGEPGRAHDRQLGARVAHGLLGVLGLGLAAAGTGAPASGPRASRPARRTRRPSPPRPAPPGRGSRRRRQTRHRPARAPRSSGPPSRTAARRSASRSAPGRPRASSRSATRRPVFPVPPSTSVGLFCRVRSVIMAPFETWTHDLDL